MKHGRCAICGKNKPLTAEHLPPKKALNKYPLIIEAVDEKKTTATGRLSRRIEGQTTGWHLHRLCERCNNRTGTWYATDYVEFTKVAAESQIPVGESGILTFDGRPAAVAKEALACLCTSSGPGPGESCPELRKLILRNHSRFIPTEFRLWLYLMEARGGHQTGVTGKLNIFTGRKDSLIEFAFWPLGWVLSWTQNEFEQLCDVTHWLNYEYKKRMNIQVNVHRHWTITGHAIDFRTPSQVERDRQRNRIAESRV